MGHVRAAFLQLNSQYPNRVSSFPTWPAGICFPWQFCRCDRCNRHCIRSRSLLEHYRHQPGTGRYRTLRGPVSPGSGSMASAPSSLPLRRTASDDRRQLPKRISSSSSFLATLKFGVHRLFNDYSSPAHRSLFPSFRLYIRGGL